MNPDVLEPITETDISKIGERLSGIERKPVAALVINIGDERRVPIEDFATEGDFVVEKIRLGKSDDEVFAPGPVLDPHPEFLAAAGEIRPASNIEVALSDFGETDQVIDRGKAGAEIKRAGAFLLDEHIQVFASGNERIA